MLIEKGTDKAVYTLRVTVDDGPGVLSRAFVRIEDEGASVGDVSRVGVGLHHSVRDIEVMVDDQGHLDRVAESLRGLDGVRIREIFNHVEEMHRGGKIVVQSKHPIRSISDVRKLYTPGVATICKAIAAEPELAAKYTYLRNTVAIVTNGTAILGLGDIGVVAGLPVMEGKAALLAVLAGINGIPILVDSHDPEEIIATVARIAKGFGAIKLEDVAAPTCFAVEDRLSELVDVPVMHDDQHGTAVVVLAALLNACRLSGTDIHSAKVGVIGLGAAGIGISKLLLAYGVRTIRGTDIVEDAMKRLESIGGQPTDLAGVMERSDIVVATTGCPGLIRPEMVRPGQVILALSNPNPEIKPEAASAAGAAFASDGRSINNALAFPGVFRGTLDAGARHINDAMKIAAAKAIADEAAEGDLVPILLKDGLHKRVGEAVERAALETGAHLLAR